MLEFVSEHVTGSGGRALRLRQLAAAVVGPRGLGLQYDETTRTAAGTFAARRGNCLSFSSLFVALARVAGLDARFQEVDIPPDWSLKEDAFVLNRHVNVLVDLGRAGEHVVDFDMDDFRTAYDRRVIGDARALAHFYNNVAVARMLAGDHAAALAGFREATARDPRFSPAWTNLGILYLRAGESAYAEAAFQQALKVDATDLVAMSNLARLYEAQGDPQRAGRYRDRVRAHHERNPYYRFQQARAAFDAGDYDAAIGHLNAAILVKKNEDRFYHLLGVSYSKKGDERAARRFLARAREVAATDAQKRRYADKIRLLTPSSDGPEEQ
jgi:Flp pilus assembly protein TadD